MTLPRKSLISLSETPYYHCFSRCLRRAYLCGYDHINTRDYEHRRSWLEFNLLKTAELFGIKVCSYAAMRFCMFVKTSQTTGASVGINASTAHSFLGASSMENQSARRKAQDARRKTQDARRKTQWAMGNGQWAMGNGQYYVKTSKKGLL